MRDEIAKDAGIAALAARQHGVVHCAQLSAAGVSRAAIHRRVRAGRLHPCHRGVYAVGHPLLTDDGRWWAAVLAYRPDGVLSHTSAAVAWDLARSASAVIDVSVGVNGRRQQPGVRLHRRPRLAPGDVTTRDGLPITTPARTLLDLAATGWREDRLGAAVDRAELLRLIDFAGLRARCAPGRRGAPALRTILARYGPEPLDTRSRLEQLVGALCLAHDLPRPQVNVLVEGRVRDFCWPNARLVVEADSYAWHRSPRSLDDDRERDAALVLAGWRVLRFTWEQVRRRPDYVAATLLRALGAGRRA